MEHFKAGTSQRTPRMFESLAIRDARPIALLKRVSQVIVVAFLLIGAISSYRAYVQVRSLDLNSSGRQLQAGSLIHADVVSSGRAPVDVRVELVQGPHTETIEELHIPDNDLAFFDPRPQKAFLTVILNQELLARFQAGAATVRATAIGREQWTRLPPPTVRELAVEIKPQ